MGNLTLQVAGLDDMRRRMGGIADKLVAGAIKAGLRQGANIIKAQVKENFGSGGGPQSMSGALRASIRVTPRRGTPTRVVFNVVAGELTKAQATRITKAQTKKRGGTLTEAQAKKLAAESAYWALWVEKGHINRGVGQALRGSKASVKAARGASTSNTPAHPFMRPAIAAKAQEAIDMMIRVIGEKLPEAAR